MKISKDIIEAVFKHAEEEAPLEACGYLAGKDGVVKKLYRMTNIDRSEEHFSFDPKEQFDVLRAVRADDREILAVYHSHPATPARPSEEDIRLAYDPEVSYVIASLKDNERTIESFKIKNGEVEHEPIKVV